MAFGDASPSLPEQAQSPPPFTTASQSSEQLGSNSSNNNNNNTMNRRIWNVQQSTQSSPADAASLSSRGSMHLDSVGGSLTTTASQHTASSSCASVGSNFESLPAGPGFVNYSFEGNASRAYGYYLDRGNGQFTRLIPADTLPPLKGVPARQERHDRMVVLKPIENLHPQNAGDYLQVAVSEQHSPMADNLQNQIDCIVATSPKSNRRVKIYCDKWIHEGVCAFTQQGCKFKHEMPQDEATQRSLGLFHGFPAWWKKRVEEQNVPRRALNTPPPSSSSPGFLGTATTPHLGSSEALRGRSHPLTPPTVFEPQLAQQQQQQQQQYQRSLPLRDSLYAPTSFAPGPTNWRASGSQWMQNGIVPFARGPRRAY